MQFPALRLPCAYDKEAASTAKRQLDKIALVNSPKVTVVREGHEKVISPAELVKGDIIRVGPGDQIVVDGVMIGNGLFYMIVVAYALGASTIARQGALVQQVNAIESLSNIDVLCMDKTGTLTANRLLLH